jgi:hypothetical protein
MKAIRKKYWLILLAFALISCSPLVQSDQPSYPKAVLLHEGKPIGQTFTAIYDGLEEIRFFFTPIDQGNGTVELKLFDSSDRIQPIARSTLDTEEVSRSAWYSFPFDPQESSNLQDYYLELTISDQDELKVGAGFADSYLDGSMYLSGVPTEKQIAYKLGYRVSEAILGIGKDILNWAVITISAVFLFVLPGWLILGAFWKEWSSFHWLEKLGYGAGLSLAIYPILFLWFKLLQVQPGIWIALMPVLVSSILYIWVKRDEIKSFQIRNISPGSIFSWQNFTLVILIGLIFAVRFWVIRSLLIPQWGDGYQHTMITQLIMENKGLFEEWLPYAELQTFTYHFGFHATSALLGWLTSSMPGAAVIYMGQIINGLAVLTLFTLSMRIRRGVLAGTITILLAGLLLNLPMFFVNWSRFTQLAGLAILAIFVSACWRYLRAAKFTLSGLLISSLLLAGLGLTHYRVLIIAGVFILAFILLYFNYLTLQSFTVRVIALAATSFVAVLPWIINIFSGKLTDILEYQVSSPTSQINTAQTVLIQTGNLFNYLPAGVWILLPVLLAWAFWRQQRAIALISLWWFLAFLLANPQWFKLPGNGVITSFAILISAFFPVSLIIGESIAGLIEGVIHQPAPSDHGSSANRRIHGAWINAMIAVILVSAGLWGAYQTKDTLNKYEFSLTTRPDLRAAEWIDGNLPPDAKFLVNSFFAYGGSLIAGSDAGWWLPLTAERQTTLPPLTYGSEQGPTPDYLNSINNLTASIIEYGVDHPVVMEMLENYEITHIYIGQRQGSVGSDKPLFHADELLASDRYDPVYHQDRVWIFKINPG